MRESGYETLNAYACFKRLVFLETCRYPYSAWAFLNEQYYAYLKSAYEGLFEQAAVCLEKVSEDAVVMQTCARLGQTGAYSPTLLTRQVTRIPATRVKLKVILDWGVSIQAYLVEPSVFYMRIMNCNS